jgi:hypothetical protein
VTNRRHVLVITSCTGTKTPLAPSRRVAAEDLYAGEQHRRLMRGVRVFRSLRSDLTLDLRILSAGHGLVRGDAPLEPYDATFSGLTEAELVARSESLGVAEAVAQVLSQPFELVLLLLGDDYLRAASLGPQLALGGPALAFCGRTAARRLGPIDGLKTVPTTNHEARRFSCGLVGLKGELGARTLTGLAGEPDRLSELTAPQFGVLDWLEGIGAAQAQFKVAA